MSLLDRLRGKEKEEEHEIVYENPSKYNKRASDITKKSETSDLNYESLLLDTEGEVQIDSYNPHGGVRVDDSVSSVKALDFLKEVYDDQEYGDHMYLRMKWFPVSHKLDYKLIQGDRFNRHAVYKGSLESDVEKEEVEPILDEYGINRFREGWEFSNVEGKLEEFETGEDSLQISYESLKSAVMDGTVENISFNGEVYDQLSDEEVISVLLEDVAVGEIDVSEVESGDRIHYDVDIEELEIADIRPDISLHLSTPEDRPLFTDRNSGITELEQ
jgi:hypothetical protein